MSLRRFGDLIVLAGVSVASVERPLYKLFSAARADLDQLEELRNTIFDDTPVWRRKQATLELLRDGRASGHVEMASINPFTSSVDEVLAVISLPPESVNASLEAVEVKLTNDRLVLAQISRRVDYALTVLTGAADALLVSLDSERNVIESSLASNMELITNLSRAGGLVTAKADAIVRWTVSSLADLPGKFSWTGNDDEVLLTRVATEVKPIFIRFMDDEATEVEYANTAYATETLEAVHHLLAQLTEPDRLNLKAAVARAGEQVSESALASIKAQEEWIVPTIVKLQADLSVVQEIAHEVEMDLNNRRRE